MSAPSQEPTFLRVHLWLRAMLNRTAQGRLRRPSCNNRDRLGEARRRNRRLAASGSDTRDRATPCRNRRYRAGRAQNLELPALEVVCSVARHPLLLRGLGILDGCQGARRAGGGRGGDTCVHRAR